MLVKLRAQGHTSALIVKGLALAKQVQEKDGKFLVPGSNAFHTVTVNPDSCDCRANQEFHTTCSHILALKFYLERKEFENLVKPNPAGADSSNQEPH